MQTSLRNNSDQDYENKFQDHAIETSTLQY